MLTGSQGSCAATASNIASFSPPYAKQGNERGAARRCLDSLALPIFVVDGDLHCEDLNAAAHAVVLRADGVALRQYRLSTVDDGAIKPLRVAIEKATVIVGPETTSLVIPRPKSLSPYIATVSPLPMDAGPALAMVVLCDPKSASASAGPKLRQLFGLTSAEASLAVALAEGMTPDEIADARQVSLNTVRTQLRAVCDKMGFNRLAQVAAIVAGLPPT